LEYHNKKGISKILESLFYYGVDTLLYQDQLSQSALMGAHYYHTKQFSYLFPIKVASYHFKDVIPILILATQQFSCYL